MTLTEAIDTLGQHGAARIAKVPRTTIQAWRDNGTAPKWRQGEMRKIIRAAERQAEKESQAAA